MNALLRSWALPSGLSVALCLASLGAAGCTDDKKTQKTDADAGAEQGPQKPVLGAKLAAAVQAAESAQAASPSKSGADGPPENGVFGPGMADKAQAAGAPAKLEVLGEGSEPRILFAPAPVDEQKETASVTVRLQGGAIPVEYALALKVDKPKDEKKAEGPKSWRVTGKVTAISVPAQVPRDLSDKLAKLKGTEIRYTIGPAGGATDIGYTLGKDADPGLGEAVVKGLVNAVGVSTPPFPSKPIGAGAYWIVTDRANTFGVEVVRYRVYKLEKVDKDTASISVDVRQYAAKDDADLGALANGQKMTLQRFESQGKGKLDWVATALLAPRGETSQRTAMAGAVAGGQQAGGQQAVLQADVTARFTDGAGKK